MAENLCGPFSLIDAPILREENCLSNTILITGGAGYLGSHAALALLQAGKDVLILDNLCNSSLEALSRVGEIAGRSPVFVHGDVRDAATLKMIFSKYKISAVLHFAGLKAVGESVREPHAYYENNLVGTLELCRAMFDSSTFRLVFSSSATVYGNPHSMPVSEFCPTELPANPYGRSKLMAEQILEDLARADASWRIAVLRYFNPVGAHPSGLIGEDPRGIPNNLVPYISQVAAGRLQAVQVFGDDYPTSDGTGVRDYIHVMDLVKGHLHALQALEVKSGLQVWNLGTGRGYSVLEVLKAFEAASGIHIPYVIAPRREGDVAQCWADPSKAWSELGWRAEYGLEKMLEDAWRWQAANPNGYLRTDTFY